MYSYDDRIRAVRLYIQYDKSAAAVIRELGYPERKTLRYWYKAYLSDNALERIRGHQMKELTAQGELEFEIQELTRMILKEVIVKDTKTFTIKFLDGTMKNISL